MEPTKILSVSKAAYGLCSWIIAMEAYDRVAKVVAPKKEALRIAEAEYNEVMEALLIKQAALKKVNFGSILSLFWPPILIIPHPFSIELMIHCISG
mgnify:FL=1